MFESFGADLSLCDDQGKWISFVHLYSLVVENSELILEKVPSASWPAALTVKRVTIRSIRSADLADGTARVYPMSWMVEYDDGRVGQLELSDLGLFGASLTIFDPRSDTKRVAIYEETP